MTARRSLGLLVALAALAAAVFAANVLQRAVERSLGPTYRPGEHRHYSEHEIDAAIGASFAPPHCRDVKVYANERGDVQRWTGGGMTTDLRGRVGVVLVFDTPTCRRHVTRALDTLAR